MSTFTHLHLHTEYSLLDGVCHIKELIPYLKEKGFGACAITDHGVMYGAFQFHTICKEYGIKPIMGCEIYLAKRTRSDKDAQKDRGTYHMTLLARTQEGYKNLMKIVTIGQLEGMYYKPRVDDEILEKYGKGLIATTGCMSGKVPRLLLEGKYEKAKKEAEKFRSYFGKENYFIEIQRNGVEEVTEKLNPLLEQLAAELDIPIIATCDSHYIHPDDYIAQEILWCVADGKKITDPTRRAYSSREFYVKTPEEMEVLFKDHPEYLENTQKVVDMIEDFDVTFGRVEPEFNSIPEGENAATYLKKLVYEGAVYRYGEVTEDIKKRIEYELGVIHSKNYDNYFLVVQDYVKWAKLNDIMVGPGRGSGAGSLVAYCLQITDIVDPLYWNLPFERFLNPERPSAPDFDIDFEDTKRDRVVQYMKVKYGESKVANIAAIGRMKTKAAIRDVARVMGIDLSIADKLSKLVPVHQGKSPLIKEAIEAVPEMQDIINQFPNDLNQLVKYVAKVEGTARHISKHACGVVVTSGDVVEYSPLQRESRNEENIITQYESVYLEPIGLLKFDFLGLSNLTQIKNTVRSIKKNRGIEVDIEKLPFDDKETYEVFQRGETLGIFQFESEGMRKYLKELKPDNIFEISFMAAAYRPGPMAYIQPYIDCKFGRKEAEYLHEDLKSVLEETYGYPIYQEQVMQIAVVMAGYSLGRADILRRAMGKKKIEVLMAEKEPFVEAVIANGHNEDMGNKLFDYMVPFSSYGFNKAHSAAYAVIAYQTAYLKAHFFPEYMAVLLETNLGDFEKVNMVNEECRAHNINILPPDINKSDCEFLIEDGNIRYGFYAAKGGSAKAMEEIVLKRGDTPYECLEDLCMRIDLSQVTKKSLELLIKCGAMDRFGKRSALLSIMPEVYERANAAQKRKADVQVSLFQGFEDEAENTYFKVRVPDIPESSEILSWEKDILGIYVSSHPMINFTQMAERKSIVKIKDLAEYKGKKNVKMVGIITSLKKILTKKDGKPMAFGVFEDLTSKVELVVFPNSYEKLKDKIVLDTPVIIKGNVEVKVDLDKKEDIKVFLDDIAVLDDKFKNKPKKEIDTDKMLVVNVKSDPSLFAKLNQLIKSNPGVHGVKLMINTNGKVAELALKDKVNLTEFFLKEISALVGEGYSLE